MIDVKQLLQTIPEEELKKIEEEARQTATV